MKFIEKNKHRQIEKDTMELAVSWYCRYKEKEEQIDEIENEIRNFELWFMEESNDGKDSLSVAEIQKAFNRTFSI